eukprot:4911377-Pyramimonas_sp.AAC.1
MDFTFIVGYAHTEPHGSQKDRRAQEKRCKHFWLGLTQMMDMLPPRTVPILMIDANARIGSVGSDMH